MGDDETAAHTTSRAVRQRKGKSVLFADGEDGTDTENSGNRYYVMPRVLRYEIFQLHLKKCVQDLIHQKQVPVELMVSLGIAFLILLTSYSQIMYHSFAYE